MGTFVSMIKYNVLVLFIYLRLFFCGHCDKKVVIHNTQSFSLRYNREHSAEMSDGIRGGLVVSFSKRAWHGKGHQSISCKRDVQGERTVTKRLKKIEILFRLMLSFEVMHKEQVLNYVSLAQKGTSLDSKRLSCLLRFNLVSLFKWIASQKKRFFFIALEKENARKPVLEKV